MSCQLHDDVHETCDVTRRESWLIWSCKRRRGLHVTSQHPTRQAGDYILTPQQPRIQPIIRSDCGSKLRGTVFESGLGRSFVFEVVHIQCSKHVKGLKCVSVCMVQASEQIFLVRHIFHIHFQEIDGSVNPGRGITPLSPLLHSFLNV